MVYIDTKCITIPNICAIQIVSKSINNFINIATQTDSNIFSIQLFRRLVKNSIKCNKANSVSIYRVTAISVT